MLLWEKNVFVEDLYTDLFKAFQVIHNLILCINITVQHTSLQFAFSMTSKAFFLPKKK